MARLFRALFALTALLAILSFQNCAQPVSIVQESPSLDSQGTVICDPFSSGGVAAPGIKATMVYYDGSDASSRIKSINDIFTLGKSVDKTVLYFSQIYVPTRSFADGFDVQGGKLLTPSGQILTEWFGLKFESNLQLTEAEADGLYQVATISDDGSVLEMDLGSGYAVMANNDGVTSARLRCGATFSIAKGQEIPMRLWYFQGPRTQIAVNLLWRKVESGMSLQPSYCGTTSDLFSAGGVWGSKMLEMQKDGWKVLAPGNFKLNDGTSAICGSK